jgi:hypothetical protein
MHSSIQKFTTEKFIYYKVIISIEVIEMKMRIDWMGFEVEEKKTKWGRKFVVKGILRIGKTKVKVRNFQNFYDYKYDDITEDDIIADLSPIWVLTKTQMKKILRENPDGWKIRVDFYFDPQVDGTFYGDGKFEPLDVNWLLKRLDDFDWNIVYNFREKVFEIYNPAIDSYTLIPPAPVFLEGPEKDKAVVFWNAIGYYEVIPKKDVIYI